MAAPCFVMKDGTVIDYDPVTGRKTKWYYEVDDKGNETITLKHCFPTKGVQEILDMNKQVQNAGKDVYRSITPGEVDMWYAAQIPAYVQYKWMSEEGINIANPHHWDRVKKKLSDPEWRYLRTGNFSL